MGTNLRTMKDKELISYLTKVVDFERKNAARLIDILREVDSRRLYLKLGFSSFFAYLTEGFGYSPASAQRRIDAARLSREIPEIKEDIASGSLNFTQISILTQGLRQKKKEGALPVSVADKKQILMEIKNRDLKTTQHVVSEKLDLPVLTLEKARIQKDSSTRLEMTFTESQMKNLERVKELLSHKHPNLSWAELVMVLAEDHLKRKDPLRKAASTPKDNSQDVAPVTQPNSINTKKTKNHHPEMESFRPPSTSDSEVENPRFIPAATKRFVQQRDHGVCQWRNSKTRKLCGSRFQVQIDHKTSVWAGGLSAPENLQLLCSAHNALKYQQEAGIHRRGDSNGGYRDRRGVS